MQRLSVFLVISCVSGVLAQIQATITTTSLISITPAPSTPVSGLSEGLIGYSYVSQLEGYTTWFCSPGSIWSTVGAYARCCTDDPFVECGIATACLNTSLLVGPGSAQIWTCTGTGYATSCITGTVYDSISGTGSVINIDCYPSWSAGNWNATRDIIITSSSMSPTTTPSTITTSSPAPGTTPSIFPAITSPLSQASSSTFQANPSSSKTSTISPQATTTSTSSGPNIPSIVAITFGAIVAVIVVIGTFYTIYRRRPKQRDSSDSEGDGQQPDINPTGGVVEVEGDGRRGTITTTMSEIGTTPTRTTRTMSEIDTMPIRTTRTMSEIDTTPRRVTKATIEMDTAPRRATKATIETDTAPRKVTPNTAEIDAAYSEAQARAELDAATCSDTGSFYSVLDRNSEGEED